MELTAGRIHDAVNAIVNIGQRPSVAIPQLAKKKLQMIHRELLPSFELVKAKMNALIQQYGEEQFADAEKTKSLGTWTVKPEHKDVFNKEWDAVRAEVINVPLVKPLQFEMLGNELRGIEITELDMLGELVTDPRED